MDRGKRVVRDEQFFFPPKNQFCTLKSYRMHFIFISALTEVGVLDFSVTDMTVRNVDQISVAS